MIALIICILVLMCIVGAFPIDRGSGGLFESLCGGVFAIVCLVAILLSVFGGIIKLFVK